jgi:molybdopterin-binding protein
MVGGSPFAGSSKEADMPISARNQLQGTVQAISLGQVMAEVVIDVGGQEVVAAITRHSVESLGLKEGDSVTAIIKATEVMVMK